MWRRGRVVKAFARVAHSGAESRFEPGHATAFGPSTARTRLTQPATATFSGTANRVPALAGVKAETSSLSGGR